MNIYPLHRFTLRLLILGLVTVVLSIQPVRAIDEGGPAAIVNELHSVLADMMQNAASLGYQGRYELIHPLVVDNFDTGLIAQVVLSRHWKDLDSAEQARFVGMFQELSAATYASRFSDFNGESFHLTGGEALKRGRYMVRTELQRPGEEPVRLDYLMHKKDDRWLIIGVIANGVNDLSLKRAEYASVMKENGYNVLVEEIMAKIRGMQSESPVDS